MLETLDDVEELHEYPGKYDFLEEELHTFYNQSSNWFYDDHNFGKSWRPIKGGDVMFMVAGRKLIFGKSRSQIRDRKVVCECQSKESIYFVLKIQAQVSQL